MLDEVTIATPLATATADGPIGVLTSSGYASLITVIPIISMSSGVA